MQAGKFALVNYGGSFQLEINDASDLEALSIMDEAFWMSTSAPTFGLNCDDDLITLLDRNKNNRILSNDVRDATEKLLKVLKNRDGIDKKLDSITPGDFKSDDPEGNALSEAAVEILNNLDKKADERLSLKEIQDDKAILCDGLTNGDGIIPPEDVEDPELQQFIKDVMLCLGSHDDVNGKAGIGEERLKNFVELAGNYLTWKDSRHFNPDILPLQEKTADAYNTFAEIRYKIEEYFKLCELKTFNKTLNRKQVEPPSPENVYTSACDLENYLEFSPLALVSETSVLELDKEINPLFRERLQAMRVSVLDEFLDGPVNILSKLDWEKVCKIFKPYEDWQKEKSGIEVKALDDTTLRRYVKGDLPLQLQKMIEKDKLLGEKLKVRDNLEEVVILQKSIIDFCNNYVSFPHLYNPEHRAIFEIGYLVIDGRIFNFNIPVRDIKNHSEIAKRSGIFLMYLDVSGSEEDKPFSICTPVTSRKLGLLDVGKRGVLFDLDGKEWDAKIVKVVQNPVSLYEAATAPFRKVVKMFVDAIDKISSGTEKELEKKLNKATTDFQKDITAGPKKPVAKKTPKPSSSTTAKELMLTGSVTFAALGSSFAYISSTFAKLDPYKALAVFAIGILVVLIPVLIISSIKLHRRNISSILEASGWAVNATMRLTSHMAKILAPVPDKPGKVFKRKRDLLKSFSSRFKFKKKKSRRVDG